MLIIVGIKLKNFWVSNFMQRVVVVLIRFSRRKCDPERKTKIHLLVLRLMIFP